jgi:Fe-S-cluster-containing dehydrogenase component
MNQLDRRRFLKGLGLAGAGMALPAADAVRASHARQADPDAMGVFVDTSYCVGCRKCEWACESNWTGGTRQIDDYANASSFAEPRRPDADSYCVVNAYPDAADPEKKHFVKLQCMHCVDPACVSACIVGALRKEKSGAVSYDAGKCIGCRYCMVACPFQVPAYEYDKALAPRVMKCSLCLERTREEGSRPACVDICPEGCLVYGRREELIAYAHRRLEERPERYHPHVYGEQEVGGTSWLYLAAMPLAGTVFPELPDEAPPHLTERVQHGIFKHFFPPLALYGLLGGIMWLNREREEAK